MPSRSRSATTSTRSTLQLGVLACSARYRSRERQEASTVMPSLLAAVGGSHLREHVDVLARATHFMSSHVPASPVSIGVDLAPLVGRFGLRARVAVIPVAR